MIARAVVCIALFVSLSTLSVGGTQITPELIRDRTEREWIVKAEKMRQPQKVAEGSGVSVTSDKESFVATAESKSECISDGANVSTVQ